jgi:hypothetical protein
VKGGVGKSTVALLVAERAARAGRTLLVDLDLTGTSLADVLPLEAPDVGLDVLDLSRAPVSPFLTVDESRARVDTRRIAEGWRPIGVPFLNDFLLGTPDRFDARLEHHPLSVAWRLAESELMVAPSSALPRDLAAILPVIYDELNAGFLEGRVEWLLEQILVHTDIRTVVFDAPPTIPGLSGALLSMAMRLPDAVHLAPEEPQSSPERLFSDEVKTSWVPLFVVSPDHQDLRAAERWLIGKEEAELRRFLTVVNGRDPQYAGEEFLHRLRIALDLGFEPDDPPPPDTAYAGPLLEDGRAFTLLREPNFRPWRTAQTPEVRREPEGFEALFHAIEGKLR